MSILDVTEDKIFNTLGKGRDPNFKPIEKVRPPVIKPKKMYTLNQTVKPVQTIKPADAIKTAPPLQAVAEPVKSIPLQQVDESIKKFTEDLDKLNNRVNGIQNMVRWFIIPQFVVVLILLLALILKV